MLRIQNITQDPKQLHHLILDDGSVVALSLYYVPQQLGWFITEMTYGDFVLKGIRISNQPNILRQWKNMIPFGLACTTKGQREPTLQQDFSSGNANLYILTADEVEEYEDILRA